MKMNQKTYRGILMLILIIFCFSIFPYNVSAATSFPCYGTVTGTANYGGLNVRKSPSSSSESLGKLSDGTLVKLESETNGWYKISYKDQTAYIYGYNGKYVSLNSNYTSNNSILYYGTISGSDAYGGLNVRKGPSSSYASLGKLSDGTQVYLLSEKNNGWYTITYNNQTAYISSGYITNITSNKSDETDEAISVPNAVVLVENLNVRKGPSTSYASLGKLSYGYQIEVLEKTNNGWYKITYKDQTAYIYGNNGKYVALEKGMGMVVNSDQVNIRSTPNIPSVYDKNVITIVIRGGILKFFEDPDPNDKWVLVEANALIGYINSDYFDKLTESEYNNMPKGEVIFDNVIAQYQTKIRSTAHEGSRANIKSGADFVNGTIVAPGQTFDYYGITHPEGFLYEYGTVLKDGEYVLSRGGGLCQVSTTIHAAIRHAKLDDDVDTGLNITARFPHGKPSSYVDDRADEAMIASYYKTFAFRNTNTYSIKILTNCSLENNTLTVTIVKV